MNRFGCALFIGSVSKNDLKTELRYRDEGHIHDSLDAGVVRWLVKNGKWIIMLRSQLCGKKNHAMWL